MGVYKVGDLMVPQEFQNVSVKGGKIVTEKKFYHRLENPSKRGKVRASSCINACDY